MAAEFRPAFFSPGMQRQKGKLTMVESQNRRAIRLLSGMAGMALMLLGAGCAAGVRGPAGAETWNHPGALFPSFQAADPVGMRSREVSAPPSYSDPDDASDAPGVGDYFLYIFVGAPRDGVAMVLEPVGYVSSVAGGLVLNVVVLPFSFIYYGQIKVDRAVSRSCVMAAGFPFFIVSDVFSRSFTGDMNRYRWGVHPFPRTDHRFFPNYHAILAPEDDEN